MAGQNRPDGTKVQLNLVAGKDMLNLYATSSDEMDGILRDLKAKLPGVATAFGANYALASEASVEVADEPDGADQASADDAEGGGSSENETPAPAPKAKPKGTGAAAKVAALKKASGKAAAKPAEAKSEGGGTARERALARLKGDKS